MSKTILWFAAIASCIALSSSYIAAVFEHNPYNSTISPSQTIEENIIEYVKQINYASGKNAQIVVFPEYGLTGLVLEPKEYSFDLPENGTSFGSFTNDWLMRLSNAARSNRIYVVVNLLERSNNTDDKAIYYNTNIVFDPDGTLIAKYRKINLWNEPKLTPGRDLATFTTNFGVTFGLMTCFDILYHHPARTILQNGSVTDIVFPHAWHSILPLYSSLTVQAGYASAARVNLLAANLNKPSEGVGGSAIYQKDKTLASILTGKAASEVLTADVNTNASPFVPFGLDIGGNDSVPDIFNYKVGRDFDAKKFEFKNLNLANAETSEKLCDGKFCCDFRIIVDSNKANNTEIYKLVAYDGPVSWGSGTTRAQFCGLVSCATQGVDSCGFRPPADLVTPFTTVSIRSTLNAKPDDVVRPATLLGGLRPVYNATFGETWTNGSVTLTLATTKTEKNVVFLGLYVRKSGAGGPRLHAVALVAVAVGMVRMVLW